MGGISAADPQQLSFVTFSFAKIQNTDSYDGGKLLHVNLSLVKPNQAKALTASINKKMTFIIGGTVDGRATAMLLAGLGLIGFAARRRDNR